MGRSANKPIRLEGWNTAEYKVPELKGERLYELAVPLPSINVTNDPMDIASDYAWALHAAQLLSPHVSHFSHRPDVSQYWHSELLLFSPVNIPECMAAIKEIGLLYCDGVNEDTDNARGKANEFEAALLRYPKVCFPDLADSYLANYVNSVESHFDEMELTNQIYQEFPTWRYYFWKSFLSQTRGSNLYASTHSWILPRDFDLGLLLKHLDWDLPLGEPKLFKSVAIKIGHLPWVLASDSVYVEIPFNCLNKAAECWHNCLWNSSQATERWSQSFKAAVATFKSDVQWVDTHIHREYLTEGRSSQEWFVSGDGSIVTVSFDDVTLLTFLRPDSKLRPEIVQKYLNHAEEVCSLLYPRYGLPAASPCQWAELDDEKFEQLCYDILLRCDRFNSSRIRKLGKSRSRDGGRDIEVWTQARRECAPQKWIYQCKFSASACGSLSGSQVSVSDVVDQYEADGFGVMTNRVIDATLYDKLDQISANRSSRGARLEVDTWSVLEIERFLYPRKDLIARYFERAAPEADTSQ